MSERLLLFRQPLVAHFPRAVGNASGRFIDRQGLMLTLVDANGHRGLGEASPLFPHTTDSWSDVEAAIASLPSAIDIDANRTASFGDRFWPLPETAAIETLSPTLAFALDMAAADLFAQRDGSLLANWLRECLFSANVKVRELPPPGGAVLPLRHLLDDIDSAVDDAQLALSGGARAFKIKVGRPHRFKDELEVLNRLRGLDDSVHLSVDANEMWSLRDWPAIDQALFELGISAVEDPLPFEQLFATERKPLCPIALDAPLLKHRADAIQLVRSGVVKALVIKPTSFGRLHTLLSFLLEARDAGAQLVFSHVLESPLALSFSAQLAMLFGTGPQGLGAFTGSSDFHLDGLSLSRPDWLTSSELRAPARGLHGLAVSLSRASSDQLRFSQISDNDVNRSFVIDETGTHTFGSLMESVASRRNDIDALFSHSPSSDQRLAFVGQPSLNSIVTVLAALDLGVTLVPLHPRHTPEEHNRTLVATSARLLPTSEDPTTTHLERQTPHANQTLAILFTSGTTGEPKGALLSRRAFLASASMSHEILPLTSDDRWLLAMPLAHVGGLSVVTRCLLARATVVLAPPSFDAHETMRLIETLKVTLVSFVPTMLSRIVALGLRAPGSVRAVLLGGAACPQALMTQASALGWPIYPTYGLTEMCSQVATAREPARGLQGDPSLDAPVGPPLPGVNIKVVDGRICVRSLAHMDGWRNMPDSPFDQDGYYDTGDLGALDQQGRLSLFGRRRDLIICGGENVYPREVENALLAVSGVDEACVVGLDDSEWGQIVGAAFVSKTGTTPESIVSALSGTLARFKVPKVLRPFSVLPMNANGKLDRLAVERELSAYKRAPTRGR